MISEAHISVFEKYKDAGLHAFSNDIVTAADKNFYFETFTELLGAAEESITGQRDEQFKVWSVRFHRNGGVQGHRPVDLWVCVINKESEVFARYPQIYMIASSSGLEIGFAVTIHEDDYYNLEIKQRNRNIVPVVYRKLPEPNSTFIQALDADLAADRVWKFGLKSRQGAMGNFASAAELVSFLKSASSSERGGGSIYRIITPQTLGSPTFNLKAEFAQAVDRFETFMRRLLPSPEEAVRLTDQHIVDKIAQEIPEFNPTNIDDGRTKLLQLVAIRQGQAKFREKLFDAYGARCAVTGTAVASTLQAAHIVPYRGPQTNTVDNGILLRADIHNLFDMGLIQIEPATFKIRLSEELLLSGYAKLQGRKLRLPKNTAQFPSNAALTDRRRYFASGANEKIEVE